MLGVVFGVGSVVAMLSVGEGASRQALQQIEKLGAHNVIITSIKPQEDERATSASRRTFMSIFGLLYADEQRIAETCPDVETTVPAKINRVEARLGERAMDVRLVGTTPGWFDLVERPLLAGRVITQHDEETSANVCVLAEQAARQLLAGANSIGQTVTIGSNAFVVIGIVRTEDASGGGVQTPDEPTDAYIPLSTARMRFGDLYTSRGSGSYVREQVELHKLIARVDEIENVEPTADAIRTMLERFHKKTDYQISVPLSLLNQARETQRIFSIVLGSIAGISLLVGGIGIMNIMLASVTERTREIGIRRAIGAKRKQIIGQFLIETMVLSLMGGLIGVGLGILIPAMITHFAHMPTIVTPSSLILSLGISACVGIVFGLYPAYRAAMLDPIIALRHE
ncbi:MAG: FtsX-like permease family protein [Planctomycetes bacterium]|nr:FtsX-like permease family protein [Planctomycetota bacterium]